MKSYKKTKSIILIILGIFFAFSPIFFNNPGIILSNYRDEFDHDKLKISAVSGRIHIVGNVGWAIANTAGICIGTGTYSDPYIIEDLVINGGGSGSCILIENSDVYFKIENCTVYNSGVEYYDAGIELYEVAYGELTNNNVSNNSRNGILLWSSYNNTVSGNTANNNDYGITLYGSNNSIISGNTAHNNYQAGIYFSGGYNHIISGNLMKKCGLYMEGLVEELNSHNINTTNLVNDKPLYYYANENNLGPSNFTNAGQVFLVNCNDSTISNLNLSYSFRGIALYISNNNTISGNTASNNSGQGIYLENCNNNTISGNTANNNYHGIYLGICDNNILSGNTANYNNLDGIYLDSSNNTNVEGNSANNNGRYGIDLCSSNNTNIEENAVNNNNDHGIDLRFSNNSTIMGNVANFNHHGIKISSCDNNTIIGNTANINILYGIWLSGSDNNSIMGNTINHNNVGIYLSSSNYNIVSGNILKGSNYHIPDVCIYEINCIGNIFSDNGPCTNGQEDAILGYNLFFLLGILSVVAIILSIKKKKKF